MATIFQVSSHVCSVQRYFPCGITIGILNQKVGSESPYRGQLCHICREKVLYTLVVDKYHSALLPQSSWLPFVRPTFPVSNLSSKSPELRKSRTATDLCPKGTGHAQRWAAAFLHSQSSRDPDHDFTFIRNGAGFRAQKNPSVAQVFGEQMEGTLVTLSFYFRIPQL